ncbi:3-phenylpropionate/cinnamic acid dioxygenase subunit alpha [Streptomyces afghaniensis]
MGLRGVPRLEFHEGFVFVSFDPDVPPLLDYLGDAADYMTMIQQQHAGGMTTLPGTQLYSVRGNWKLAVENAMDGYHFAPTHNTFVGYLRESGYAVTDDNQYAYNLGNGHGLLVLTGHGGRISMIWEPRFGEDERVRTEAHRAEMTQRLGEERAHYVADESHILFVFPNLLLFDIEGLSIRQLEPVAPDQTDVRAWQLVPREEDPDTRALRMKTVVSFVGPGGLATPDDIEAYEAVQRGIQATAGTTAPELDYSDMSRGMADEVKGVQGDRSTRARCGASGGNGSKPPGSTTASRSTASDRRPSWQGGTCDDNDQQPRPGPVRGTHRHQAGGGGLPLRRGGHPRPLGLRQLAGPLRPGARYEIPTTDYRPGWSPHETGSFVTTTGTC